MQRRAPSGVPVGVAAQIAQQFGGWVVPGLWLQRGSVGTVLAQGFDDGVGGRQQLRGQLGGERGRPAEGGGDVPRVDGGVEGAGRRRGRGRQGTLGSGVGTGGASARSPPRPPGRWRSPARAAHPPCRPAPGRLEGVVLRSAPRSGRGGPGQLVAGRVLQHLGHGPVRARRRRVELRAGDGTTRGVRVHSAATRCTSRRPVKRDFWGLPTPPEDGLTPGHYGHRRVPDADALALQARAFAALTRAAALGRQRAGP